MDQSEFPKLVLFLAGWNICFEKILHGAEITLVYRGNGLWLLRNFIEAIVLRQNIILGQWGQIRSKHMSHCVEIFNIYLRILFDITYIDLLVLLLRIIIDLCSKQVLHSIEVTFFNFC